MATRAQIIDDIELRIYKGKPSDDSELSRRQIAYIIDHTRDEILTDKLTEQHKRGKELEPFYYIREENLQLQREIFTTQDSTFTRSRFSFPLSNSVLPLPDDAGIIRVLDNFGSLLAKTTHNRSDYIKDLPYGGFSTACQGYYRENSNIFVEESTTTSASVYRYNIIYIPKATVDTFSDSVDYPLEESLIPFLTDTVENILRRQMQGGASDVDNDGTDPYHDEV